MIISSSTQWAATEALDWLDIIRELYQDINLVSTINDWVAKYNLVYTTNNIYLTQKQGGGASKKIIDGGCSGRYSPSI